MTQSSLIKEVCDWDVRSCEMRGLRAGDRKCEFRGSDVRGVRSDV